MLIRQYKTEDQDQVIKLWQDSGLVVSWNDPKKDINRKLLVDPALFLVGLLDGQIIASVMGGYEGHRGWINYLAVASHLRRKGYARQILRVVESKIKERGCPKINLMVRESNNEVIEFYQALGYKNDNIVGLGKRLEKDN